MARGFRACLCLLLVLLAGSVQGAAREAGEFPAVLDAAGISIEQLATLATTDRPWTDAQQKIAGEVVHLLRNYDAEQLDRWTVGWEQVNGQDGRAGALTSITGTVSAWEQRGESNYLLLETKDSQAIVLFARQLPRAWGDAEEDSRPSGEVRARAVLTGYLDGQGEGRPVLLADRIEWRPTGDAPPGWNALAKAGFDVSLLDEIRHHRPLATDPSGREAEAFYGMLRAAAQYDVRDLAESTRRGFPARIADWKAKAASLELQGDPSQRGRAVAEAAVRRAELGLSSVAPLFLAPDAEAGRLVLIEGTARRAVPISLDEGEATVDGDRYYELEVFTPDSQSLPVVCCVTGLPAGFPIGDAIRQRVRVSGFFFKMWQYRSRESVEAGESKAYAPIVIGPPPIWLQQAPRTKSSWLGAVLGMAFLIALAAISWTLYRQSVRDRKARARYRGQA